MNDLVLLAVAVLLILALAWDNRSHDIWHDKED